MKLPIDVVANPRYHFPPFFQSNTILIEYSVDFHFVDSKRELSRVPEKNTAFIINCLFPIESITQFPRVTRTGRGCIKKFRKISMLRC